MRSTVVALCVGLLACGSDDATLRVDLRTDLQPRLEFDTLELEVDGETVFTTTAPEGDYLAGVRIAEVGGVSPGSRELLLRLRLAGAEVATRRALLDVVAPSTAVTLVISASCAERVCPGPGDPPDATECGFGGCEPPEVEPEVDMGTGDLGPRDLGPTDLEPADLGLTCDDPCDSEDCSGHGWCEEGGTCKCDPGYGGDRCESCDGWERAVARGECAPADRIEGTEEADMLMAIFIGSFISGGAGDDVIRGAFSSDRLQGGAGDDDIFGANGGDEVVGGDGRDTLEGGIGNDVLRGGAGGDDLDGGDDVDRLVGGGGDDALLGGSGGDRYLLDGLGDDRIQDSGGNDSARCAPGLRVVDDQMDGTDRLLTFDSGGTARFIGDTIENIFCCP